MKKLFISIIAVLIASGVLAGENATRIVVADNHSGVTNSETTVYNFVGKLESIYIDISGTSTQTVTIASPYETLLTATAIAADTMYSPEYPVHDAAGSAISDVYTKRSLCNEKLTVTVTTASAGTNDVAITVKTSNTK